MRAFSCLGQRRACNLFLHFFTHLLFLNEQFASRTSVTKHKMGVVSVCPLLSLEKSSGWVERTQKELTGNDDVEVPLGGMAKRIAFKQFCTFQAVVLRMGLEKVAVNGGTK